MKTELSEYNSVLTTSLEETWLIIKTNSTHVQIWPARN
jgi:hypothetical protein